MHYEKRVIEVFEHLAHRRIALTLGTKTAPVSLATGCLLLEPRLYNLEKQVNAVHESRCIADVCGPLRGVEAITAFAVGVLAGLDLAGRPDLVSKFGVLYEEQVRQSIDPLFTLAAVPLEALQPVKYARGLITQDTFLTTKQAAARFKVGTLALKRLVKAGKLSPSTDSRGQYRFSLSQLTRHVNLNGGQSR